eukprot:5459169-Lingulodinium_polyedra.AAC.1
MSEKWCCPKLLRCSTPASHGGMGRPVLLHDRFGGCGRLSQKGIRSPPPRVRAWTLTPLPFPLMPGFDRKPS